LDTYKEVERRKIHLFEKLQLQKHQIVCEQYNQFSHISLPLFVKGKLPKWKPIQQHKRLVCQGAKTAKVEFPAPSLSQSTGDIGRIFGPEQYTMRNGSMKGNIV
jgi:hypothetical protein